MKSPRICIVEDDPIIAADLTHRLTTLGYIPEGPYASGEEALRQLERQWPDLFILDIQLEGSWDGIETARHIMKYRPVPVIFLTANADDMTFKQAKLTFPAAFISKPYRSRDLEHAIELALINFVEATSSKLTSSESSPTYLLDDRLFIKDKHSMNRVMLDEILWLEADDYACKIATADKVYIVTQTLGKTSLKLEQNKYFLRIHRSYVVNLRHITQIEESFVTIRDQKIPISKSVKEELINKIQRI